MPSVKFVDCSDTFQKLTKLANSVGKMDIIHERTLKDMISRVPGKIASAVTWMYGIKKSEISFKKNFRKGGKSAGYISAHGEKLTTLEFRYAGRLLTPLHFGMTPKTRPDGKKKYKIKAKIKKRLKALPSRPEKAVDGGLFLAPASKTSGKQLAWFRYSKDPFDIKPVKTISLPQMVDNKMVRKVIRRDIDELYHTRFDNHMKQFIKGNL